MGDYSREPGSRFQESIAKHYVGVRLQQGVPLLDADWNESEDIRKYEVQEFIRQFIGDCVPDANDGFRIKALAGGGVGTIVLQAISSVDELTTIDIVLGMSTAADVLGFLSPHTHSQRWGSSPAMLTGNAVEPFILSEGLTLTIQVNNGPEQTAIFTSDDFDNIGQATADEVIDVLIASFAGVNISAGTGNDFLIHGGGGLLESAGRMLVDGSEVYIESGISYTTQALYLNTSLAQKWGVDPLPKLTESTVPERPDIVYLDVWEREVGAEEDINIIQAAIGIETARRLRREWVVRVTENALDLSGITRLPGHSYTPIARLLRPQATGDAINSDAFFDLRRTRINVAKYLKTPIYVVRGTSIVTADDFAEVLEVLRSILIQRFQQRIFIFSMGDLYDFHVVRLAMEEILTFAAYAAMQARTGNYNNDDGLTAFNEVHRLQQEFVRVVDEYGNVGNVAQPFIDAYTALLDGPAPSLQDALVNHDMIAAVDAQQAINEWLNEAIRDLPSGSVLAAIDSVDPTTALAVNVPFNITYSIESRVVSSRERENFNISVTTAAPTSWDYALSTDELTLDSDGGTDTVVLTVTPRVGGASAIFHLTVAAARNDDVVTFTHISPNFQIGLPPMAEEILQWRIPEPLPYPDNRVPFSQDEFTAGAGQVDFQVNVINTSDTVSQRYEVVHYVIQASGDWHPVEAESSPTSILVPAGGMYTSISSIFYTPGTPALDVEGTIVVEATLIEEDGGAPAESKFASLEYIFVVTA